MCSTATLSACHALRSLSLIIGDEASMVPAHALRAIDVCLRDITKLDVPFGGKILLLGGDFRQVLPVVPHGSKVAIIENCLKQSHLWPFFSFLAYKKYACQER